MQLKQIEFCWIKQSDAVFFKCLLLQLNVMYWLRGSDEIDEAFEEDLVKVDVLRRGSERLRKCEVVQWMVVKMFRGKDVGRVEGR